jgi:regulator of protease activity HflC (stomatin/prohibitin superfamily)
MKSIFKFLAIAIVALSFGSCTTVDNGNEGFWSSYSDGVDENSNVKQGTHWHMPWTDLIQMDIRQQAVNYDDVKLKDENQVLMTVDYSIGIKVVKGQAAKLYMKHGENYKSGFVNAKVQGAVKDVFGKYKYVDILGKKRDAIETEIEALLTAEFEGNYLSLAYIEVKDVQLPAAIQNSITAKEAQVQKNLLAQKKKQEEAYLADARIEKARGDSSLIISAEFKAEAIRVTSQEIAKSPAYVEFIKWSGFAEGKGSPYGENNVFGSGTGIIKGIK